ncbi:unnamed protein product, partial [Rotaria magnacalcarata]
MSSKSNSKNRDDAPASSSAIPNSPYNLRRNQLQPVVISRTSNNTDSSNSQRTPNPIQLSSNDDEQQCDNNSSSDEMEQSADENEAATATRHAQRQNKRLPSSIKTTYNSDTNLRSHLGRAHHMAEVMFDSQRQQRVKKSHQIPTEKKHVYHTAAFECIVTDGRPFGDFRRAGMSKFLDTICPGYRGPSRKTVRRRLGVAYHQYRQQLRTTLARINAIAITVDLWTKNRTSFICLTGHAFNKVYESTPLVLGFRQFSGPHLSKSIKKYILYELKQLNIENKICAIVSDNGSDIKKAISEIKPGQRISCIAHNINLVVKNGLGLWEKSGKNKNQTQRTTTDAFDNNSDTENDIQLDPHTADIPDEIEDEADSDTEHSTDTETDADDEHETTEDEANTDTDNETEDDAGGYYTTDDDDQSVEPQNVRYSVLRLVKRIRSYIGNIRAARVVNDYVKRRAQSSDPPIKATLITDFEIRWNTTFVMVSRFKDYRSIINDINSRPYKITHLTSTQKLKIGSKEFEFTNNDWSRINDLHEALEPFVKSTNIISAKSYPTLAAAYS